MLINFAHLVLEFIHPTQRCSIDEDLLAVMHLAVAHITALLLFIAQIFYS